MNKKEIKKLFPKLKFLIEILGFSPNVLSFFQRDSAKCQMATERAHEIKETTRRRQKKREIKSCVSEIKKRKRKRERKREKKIVFSG